MSGMAGCSIVGKRPKISAEPYTKWREPWRRRVHQCVVGPFEWTVGKSLRDPGHGVSGHVFDGTRKDKETLRIELVETPTRTNAKGVQYELRSESVRVQMQKARVVELLAL